MPERRTILENNIDEPKKEEQLTLTEKEIWDVVNFARQMNGIYGSQFLTPDLVSARMKDITMNPMAATEAMLEKAMQNPKASEAQIQEFSQSFELTSMVYKRLMAYLSNMLSFDVTYTSSAKPDDYSLPRYKKDLEIVEDFLDRFEYKKELRTVVREMLRNDAYFGCFVDTGNKYILQELPSEYCKITGRWEGGFLFSFNMYWFIQPGVDINMYPKFFKKKYNEMWGKDGKQPKYIPSLSPELRAGSSWVYWVDIPVTFGVCFKLSPEIATRLPYFTPLFNDLVLQTLMRNLQKNTNMAAASKMILGEVPMLNKDVKATVKDSIAVSPDLLGKFLALVKSAISDSIRVASAPLNNIQGIDFDGDNDLYDSYLKTTLASSGVNTNLIFTSDIKPNTVETQLSLNVDEQLMASLYEQFEDFINYFVNKFTKTFKFIINFEGTDFYLNRQQRLDRQMDLFAQGIVMPQKIAAAIGMKPADFRKHMEEAAANDFMKTLTPPSVEQARQMLKYTPVKPDGSTGAKTVPQVDKKTGEPKKKGRPLKPDSELDEEGVQTRTEGTNLGRGGKE
jgi:hypothetical protein